jgi:regulator of sigma E protease
LVDSGGGSLIITILAFLLVFGILVFVHELGHFLAARFFDVEVQEFAFGFGPSLFKKKKGKVTYKINLIPLGGYVRLLGEDFKETKSKQNLMNKKPWQIIGILVAGVVMNFILAWVLLSGFYLFGGQALISGMWDHPGVTNSEKVYVVEVAKDTPAQKNDIQVGDQIEKVAGESIYSQDMVFSAVQAKGKEGVDLTIKRGDQEITKHLTSYTETIESNGKKTEFQRIGITMENKGKVQAVWYLAPVAGLLEVIRITWITIQALGSFFATIFTKFRLSEQVGGPVAIATYSGIAVRLGFGILVQFIAALSVSLAIINLVPFPAVDGGHVAMVLYEWVTGKKISIKVRETIIQVGFALLLLLAVVVTVKDLSQFGLFELIKGALKR